MCAPASAAAPSSPPTCRMRRPPPPRRRGRGGPPAVRGAARRSPRMPFPRPRPMRATPAAGAAPAGGCRARAFPAHAWARCTARVLRVWLRTCRLPEPQGLPALRAADRRASRRQRGLLADPAHIVVTAGTQQALRWLPTCCSTPATPRGSRNRATSPAAARCSLPGPSRAGAERQRGHRRRRGRAPGTEARLALVAPRTPPRSAARCRSGGGWRCWTGRGAPKHGCSRTTATRVPLGWQAAAAAGTLDRDGRVIYCGTFSKSLAPALRLGFAVVPAPLTAAFVRARTLMDRGTGTWARRCWRSSCARAAGPHIRRIRTE